MGTGSQMAKNICCPGAGAHNWGKSSAHLWLECRDQLCCCSSQGCSLPVVMPILQAACLLSLIGKLFQLRTQPTNVLIQIL